MPARGCEVAVRITGDRELRRLNRLYLGVDTVTDVLSFAGGADQLGDLALSWPAVARQAASFGHREEAELGLLLVHGLLHLLGWDHQGAPQSREMRRVTVLALRAAGLRVSPGRL